jgi:hypothetical protein
MDFWGSTHLVEDFLKGITVAAGSATVGYGLRGLIGYIHARRFRRVFGHGVLRPDDLMISVPLWRALEGSRDVPRFLKADSFGHRAEFYGPSEMYNADDMVAAAYLLNIIGNHFSEPIMYTNDAMRADWNAKTVFILGSPTANYHARFYIDRFAAEKPNAMFPCFVDIKEDDVTGARVGIKLPDKRELLLSSKEKDYGLVLRFPNFFATNRNFFVFLIAGIHAPSTREAARLLNELWNGCFRRGRVSGFVFEMDYMVDGTGRIVFEC